jgi:hypothetical protein
MNRISKFAALIIVLSLCFLTNVQAEIVGESGKNLIVEAEGQGETKLQALKAAWSEAVRVGIGMYLTSKDTLVDDELKEEIITHSRGQVDSYELLSADKVDSGWTVRIRAKIEKDILQESATMSQNKSKTVAVDTSNLAAKKVTTENKKVSATELIKNYQFPRKEEFILYDFSTKIENGKLIIMHNFKFNANFYNKFISDYVSVLDKVAIKKSENSFRNNVIEKLTKVMNGTGYPNIIELPHIDDNFKVGISLSIYKDISTFDIYIINADHYDIIKNKISELQKANAVIIMQAINDKNEIISAINHKCILTPRIYRNWIAPFFEFWPTTYASHPVSCINYTFPFEWKNLSSEVLAQMKSIKSTLKVQ